MQEKRLVLFVLALASAYLPAAENTTLTAEQAYQRLRQTGTLTDTTVSGHFDFDRLGAATRSGDYRFRKVVFEGPVSIGPGFGGGVRFETTLFTDLVSLRECQLDTFAATESEWTHDFQVESCSFGRLSRFDSNIFRGEVRFHHARFQRRLSFRDSVFRARAEFLECEFGIQDPVTKATSFSDVVFEGPALFNNSIFHTNAKFQSAVFGHDASFLNVRVHGGAGYRNVHFRGDAEFRFCRFSSVDFGDQENVTLFKSRADFRGCEFGTGTFDYVDFRGETSFVNARFGAGGASFRDADLGNKSTDFDGLSSEGAIDLAYAHMPALRLRWRELREPILAADPDAKVLAALQARLESLGDRDGALDLSYYLSRRKFTEAIAESLPAATSSPSEYIDAIGRRLTVYGEWLVWGWPTGYGTKLGRVLLLAFACWLIAALPVAATPGVLARVGRDRVAPPKGQDGQALRIYDPLFPDDLAKRPTFPGTFFGRLALALGFSFRLLFKLGPKDVRYVLSQPVAAGKPAWRTYFAALWYLGTGLLLLMMLTLANTSPIIHKLVGELLL